MSENEPNFGEGVRVKFTSLFVRILDDAWVVSLQIFIVSDSIYLCRSLEAATLEIEGYLSKREHIFGTGSCGRKLTEVVHFVLTVEWSASFQPFIGANAPTSSRHFEPAAALKMDP